MSDILDTINIMLCWVPNDIMIIIQSLAYLILACVMIEVAIKFIPMILRGIFGGGR